MAGSDDELFNALLDLGDDVLDPAIPDDQLDEMVRAEGGDPDEIAKEALGTVATERERQRLAWQVRARENRARLERKVTKGRVGRGAMSTEELLAEIEALKTDPKLAQPIALAARKRRPGEEPDADELRMLLADLDEVRAMTKDDGGDRDTSSPPEAMRDSLLGYLRRELVGPSSPEEVLGDSPCKRYSAGVLFPRVERQDEAEVVSGDDSDGNEADASQGETGSLLVGEPDDPVATADADDDDAYDEPVLLANTYYPSAMGLTCVVASETHSLEVRVSAAVYEAGSEVQNDRTVRVWRRKPLAIEPFFMNLGSAGPVSVTNALAENLAIRVVARETSGDRRVVTIAVYNSHPPRSQNRPPTADECFCQVGFLVRSPDGSPVFRDYALRVKAPGDADEESLGLLYRRRRQYAVGHGVATNWSGEDVNRGAVAEVRTDTVPAVVVPPVEPTSVGGRALDMAHLALLDGSSEEDVAASLVQLVDDYEEWIVGQETAARAVPESLARVAARHLDLCKTAVRRMRTGIQTFTANGLASRAFCLANRAILMQQYHSRLSRRDIDAPALEMPESYLPLAPGRGRWRSFQIAFILMNLPAFLEEDASGFREARETVDLIWFPTGGGKTEAYLGLAAFAIFLRRLRKPDNGGCTVLMRYTLRLLTAQQFQRAAALICACELIRKEDERRLGRERISLGLWVGSAATPNRRQDATKALNRLARANEGQRENPFQLLSCPWCGTRFDDRRQFGYVARQGTILFRCPAGACPFGKSDLPISVIDEDIYEAPPSLLLGTVDKFAMLPWRPEAASLFGLGQPNRTPPDLVIQDELHLISGPLGSMVGLYESLIQFLCTRAGRGPKIVASTATIRRAEDQCRALYDRETFQFPPPGMDIDDSFFARENPDSPGRLYVGVFASASPSPVTTLVRTGAALHQGALAVPLPIPGDDSARDPYWTQLQYFGSLRELGRAATLIEQDVPEYLRVIGRRDGLRFDQIRKIRSPVELTSRLVAEEIPEILERLKIRYAPVDGTERPIDVLLATNMISVGVDIDRLGLMVVVGQPKTTSEYIQASSRVGRTREAPGLVVALYNPGKPRDRSHYEQFRSYHKSFYKHVEPTSVTPFSVPVQERGLHALLIAVGRLVCGWKKPREMSEAAPRFREFLDFLVRRVSALDEERAETLRERLRQRLDEWKQMSPDEWGGFTPQDESRLMYPAGGRSPADEDSLMWRTPTSMRNVDAECQTAVLTVPTTREQA
jgi:hypothetical protein